MSTSGDDGPSSESASHPGPAALHSRSRKLTSWKEIAEYIGRDVRTAHRWESKSGLPVHRLVHDKGHAVYALTAEIDDWVAKRSLSPQTAASPDVEPHLDTTFGGSGRLGREGLR